MDDADVDTTLAVERARAITPAAPDLADWPRLGMGCAPLGDLFERIEEDVARETLRAAWDAGVRYYDTAPWYGHGLSEHRLGALLRDVPRFEAIVSTKVGRVYEPAPRGRDVRVQWRGGQNFSLCFDYTADGFERSLEQSRMRLGQPSVDALVIHDLDRGYHGEAYGPHLAELTGSGLDRLHRLKADGEIGAVGMGINALGDFEALAPWIEVDFFLVAMPYTLLDQAALHGPMAACVERGIPVVVGAPFASGLLADPSDPGLRYNYAAPPEAVRTRALAIEAVCARHGVPLMAAALQFPLLHPAAVSVIPGASKPEHVRQNSANAETPIAADLWRELRKEGLIDPDAPIS